MPARPSKNSATDAGPAAASAVRARRTLRAPLLRWYRRHRRDLPWRDGGGSQGAEVTEAAAASSGGGDSLRGAYGVMVSEAMLQQTQVATVVPYFERFMRAFPTLADLAAADEQQVLRLWQGLGYYRRARHLHAAARACVERHGGRVPDTVEQLLALPGVGRYTAGAIASIAFGRPAPILDGNVARVLARAHAIDEPIDQTATRDRLWALAEELVQGSAPGDLNQALMELGATVCTPRNPACGRCPIRRRCRALAEGRVDVLPVTGGRRKPRAVTHTMLALRRRGRFLFEQRPSRGLWSNMWQLPTAEQPLEDAGAWVAERFGLRVAQAERVASFTHQTTHRTISFVVLRAEVSAGRLKRHAGVWRSLTNLDDLPLPNPQRRAVRVLQEAD